MFALLRVFQLFHSRDGPAGRLASRQPDIGHEPIEGGDKAGFIAMGVVALCSFVATFGLLAFLTYRFFFWQRYSKRPLYYNQYVVLIYNLLLADLQQAAAFLLCLHWARQGFVNHPSVACVLQGWWIQTADPGSGLFVIAIAMHTCAGILRGRQLPHRAFVACVIALWVFIIILGVIPVALYRSGTFVISEAGWCWLGADHPSERLWGHYFWIFLSEFGTILLYGLTFFYLQRRLSQAAELRQNHQEKLKRMKRVVIYMVLYPLMYLILSLPLAAGRMSSSRNVVPSRAYFAVAGSLMALSGLVDAAVYTLTRQQLLLDTEFSTSNGIYGAYSSAHVHHTHITTTAGHEGKRFRVGSRLRRGLQTLTDTANDNRDDSTEDIVRKGGMELKDMGQGVYQETVFEITHERADPDEFHRRNRSG